MPPATANNLSGDVAGERVGCEHHDLRTDVLGGRDLAQRHRPRDVLDPRVVEQAAGHRGDGPAWGDRVDAYGLRDARDLVLQRQEQAAEDPGLRRRVVRMAGFAEDAGSRSDEHQRAVAGALDLAEERSRCEEDGREVRAHGRFPALERELPNGRVLGRVDTRDGCADVHRAKRDARVVDEAIDVGLDGEVRLHDRRAAELVRERAGTLLAALVEDKHACTLGRERAGARGADAAGGAGDHDALPL